HLAELAGDVRKRARGLARRTAGRVGQPLGAPAEVQPTLQEGHPELLQGLGGVRRTSAESDSRMRGHIHLVVLSIRIPVDALTTADDGLQEAMLCPFFF